MSIILLFAAGFLVGMKPSDAAGIVDESLKNRLEEESGTDVMEARMKVQAAESSRVKVIQDSIDASVSESASIEESISESESLEISREESIAASIAESISESESVEKSIEESIEASIEESVAASVAASEAEEQSIAESVRESEAIAVREAQERQAAEEAARREQEQRAAEEAAARARAESEAAAKTTEAPPESTEAPAETTEAPPETTTEAPPETTAAPQPQLSGVTILIGDSRTEGFIEYGLYPANLIYWTWDPLNVHYELANAAASQLPSKIVFLNGIDDIANYGAEGAIGAYEGYISYFQSISPGTMIYVSSVLPVTDAAVAAMPQLAAVPTYNAYIVGMCARHGWVYVDGSGGVSFANYYGDGIHMDSTASMIWLGNLRAMIGF